MRLPKWLWRFLHSKLLQRGLIIAPTVLAIGVAAFYAISNIRGQARLTATAAKLATMGIPSSREEMLDQATKPERSIVDLLDSLPLTSSDIHLGLVIEDLGYEDHEPSSLLAVDDDGDSLVSITDFFPPGRNSDPPALLANELLAALDPLSRQIQPVADALIDPSYGFPPLIDESGRQVSTLTETVRFLVFRAKLHALAGDSAAAMRDLAGPISFTMRAQQDVDSLLEAIVLHGSMIAIKDSARALACHQLLDGTQLAELENDLRELDRPAFAIRAFERDLWLFFDALKTDHRAATAVSMKRMRWGIDWSQDWDDWKDTFASWWRQLRPVGLLKMDFCGEAELMLATQTRDSQGQARNSISHQEIQQSSTAYEERFSGNLHAGLIKSTVHSSAIQSMMRTHTDLRLTRLMIACERFRQAHGKLPGSVEQLTPEFLKAPLICPLTLKPLRIEPKGEDHLKLIVDEINPGYVITLIYPAKVTR